MTNQGYPARKVSASKNSTGLKMLIMASSVVATVCGWALLAVGQIQSAVGAGAAQQSQVIVQPASPAVQDSLRSTNSPIQPTQRQLTAPNTQTQPRPLGRTRSSR